MKISKKRAKAIEESISECAELQEQFWSAVGQLEALTDREVDTNIDLNTCGVRSFFAVNTRKMDGTEFKGEIEL